MKRRKFTQSLAAGMGISSLPIGLSLAAIGNDTVLHTQEKISTTEGFILKLNKKIHPTLNQDRMQIILTYDVAGKTSALQEKIYELKTANGEIQKVFMTPLNENQLQAVFNWRLNA